MKIIDIETSKKLKEAGIEWESEYQYVTYTYKNYVLVDTLMSKKEFNKLLVYIQILPEEEKIFQTFKRCYKAYNLEELLVMVKGGWFMSNSPDRLEISFELMSYNFEIVFENADPKICLAGALIWQNERENKGIEHKN